VHFKSTAAHSFLCYVAVLLLLSKHLPLPSTPCIAFLCHVQSDGTKAELQQHLLGVFGLTAAAPRATAALLHILALERSKHYAVQSSIVYKPFTRNEHTLYIARGLHDILPGYEIHIPVCGILSKSHHLSCVTVDV
jgi:hypothetical protein